ncbi:serine/threonine protein kinase [Coniosporium apollinis CBS 100218]|uniref:Serine/threonine protein kinase n=1 Tax=Coniosporium apollinis (strain CBS 100218) TaxID=1168221 RepID=R7Z5Y7_CONA1|nr:serine/threonine protein kinase [Coniosporium apollinis CBS 100218]EON69346.1 serine/threonine protein kinase [Coniosporium apollinis CBS 100218]
MAIFHSDESLPSSLLSPGFSLIGDYVDSTLTQITQDIGGPVVDDLVTFARQLQETDLAVCNSEDFEDLNGGEAVGHGTTMTVFKCRWKSKDRVVAVKKINLGIPLGKSMLEVHEEEFRGLLKSLFLELRVMNHPWFKAHPNFVDLYGVCWEHVNGDDGISSHRPSMIVELADQTTPTLKEFVSHSGQDLTEERLIFDLLTDAAEAITMLHTTKIVHGDLKPDNILLFPAPKRLVAKLSDFGFCSPFVENRDQIGGTYYWNAPECMSEAPSNIRHFAKTLTRDIYSFGLVMWFCLFKDMPYGREDAATEGEVSEWKLHRDPLAQLEENILAKAPGLVELQSPAQAKTMIEATSWEMLWFQIWKAMVEMLKMQPDSRNISLGEMHRVLKIPDRQERLNDTGGSKAVDKSRVDDSTGIAFTRPSQVPGMSEALKSRSVSKYDAYSLMHLPLQLQQYLRQQWQRDCDLIDPSNAENLDLLLVLASCFRTGFGGEKNLAKAKALELEAANYGSDVGQIKSLTYGLLNGFDSSITAEQKVTWLKAALGTIGFLKRPIADEEQKLKEHERMIQFRAALDAVSDDFIEICLLHSFIKSHMTEWEILRGEFDGAAQDPVFCWAVDGNMLGLTTALDLEPTLLLRRKDGFTLLHVAVDYCQEHIVRKLVQEYHLSPDIKSDIGLTPIELAAMTGSIECLRLLLSLGADPMPLADQDIFTEVAISGSRESPEQSIAKGNRVLLASIVSIVENIHDGCRRPGESGAAVQDLLNGRYQISVDQIDQCGSPLEVCISVSNYDSVFALLDMGADPNSYNHTPPLHVAVAHREPVLAALLLTHGADPNLKAGQNGDQDTALHLADTTSLTISYDPPRNKIIGYEVYLPDDVAAVDTENESAIAARTKACIDVLLFFGADSEAQDLNGNTPLMRRILENDWGIAEYLLSKGASLHAKDFAGVEVIGKVESPEAVEWCAGHGAILET